MAFQEDPPAGVPEWVLTFGDMMSLLLTFFIMLVSMSELKSESRVALAVEAMKKQFGRDKETIQGAQRRRGPPVEGPAGDKALVRGIRPGDALMVGGSIHYEGDSAEISEQERLRFQPAIQELIGKPQKIEVRGHCSRRPLAEGGAFSSHWDLAYARARGVMEYLVSAGVPRKRIRLGVAAANEPALRSLEGRPTPNDRVDVFLVNEFSEEHKSAGNPATTVVSPSAISRQAEPALAPVEPAR